MTKAWCWRCAWQRDKACTAYAVGEVLPSGWRVVVCEDGELRPFCPEHAPKDDAHV